MTISALDKDTVKLITTTQVITSISTAAKELIENALDAGAKNIEINLIDNGCTLIEVKDDGNGISNVDTPYMALSSYTSKLCSFSDLDSLETYGFRGEALHALSSVSNLTIITKTEQDEAAISYTIDHYGCILNSEPCHRSTGTTVQVKEIFKQMPVRRQIITKKANQDIKNLECLIKCYAICKFFVRISYKIDNKIIFIKPSTNSFEESIAYILGKKITCNMDWIDITDTDIKMKLMVPLKTVKNDFELFQSDSQYIFVNNRPIKYKELEKIVIKIILEAFGQELSRKKPIFVIYILINAANIDVNLDPNKNFVLFKEQNVVINMVQKYLENFYGIQREVQEEKNCDRSINDYQDYSQKSHINNIENEEPMRKKQKLQTEEKNDISIKKNINATVNITNNLNSVENSEHTSQTSINKENCLDEKSEKNIDNFNLQLPSLDLSDSDSNESQNFTLSYCDNSNNDNLKENTENTPPFELTPQFETLSQLPLVDLGEDFILDEYSNLDTNLKENTMKIANSEILHEQTKSDAKKSVTLKEWSKGHLPGLKGSTDVESYNCAKTNESSNYDDKHKNVCEGFLKFSKYIKYEVTNKNPTITAPQLAHIITNRWKKLSPEERGYYRDLARDEKLMHNKDELKTNKKCVNLNKNKNRLLKAFEKMKTMNIEKNKNLVMRTTVSWHIDLKKVTEKFLNNSSYGNTNLVVGFLHSNLWVIHKSAHIWILDAKNLKKKLYISDTDVNEDNAENIEQIGRAHV